ncbi:MAG TPA: hypothetical protein VFE55_16940 [Acidimicrobiia bacterium]|nr:hypothetical protein [Acidimicrobiia bacterium]
MLLEPRPVDAAAPPAAPAPAATPGAGVDAAPPEATTPTTAPGGDRSPLAHQAGDGAGAEATAAPSPASAETVLPGQLALSDILPFTPTTAATAPPDAPPPTGPAPAGDAVADYGHAPHSLWPLLAGLGVTLAVLLIGGALLWWRNRDSHYWPA